MSQTKETQCRATAKSGMRCRAAATNTGYCYLHSEPNRPAKLGRIGGLAKRSDPIINRAALPSLHCAQELGNFLDRLLREVYEDKTTPDVAKSLIGILKLKLQVLATYNAEERIAKMEKDLKTLELMMGLPDPDIPEPKSEDIESDE